MHYPLTVPALAVLLLNTTGAAGAPQPYIAKYLHDRQGAFSITCDDGFSHQVENTVSILEPLGLKATFFIMPYAIEKDDSAQFVTWERVKRLQAAGNEIGTHGRIKNKLHLVDDDIRNYEINGGYALIRERTGAAPVSWAAPGGSKLIPVVEAKVREHHYFIRSSKTLPDAVVGGYGSVTGKRQWSVETGRKNLLASIADRKWRIAVMHSVVEGWSPFKSMDECRNHFRWVAEQDNLWIAPMGTVGRYVYMQRAARLDVQEQHDGSMVFSVVSGLKPAAVFNALLTVVLPVAAVAAEAALPDGTGLPVTLQQGKLMVDVPADGRPVRLEWQPADGN